MAANKNMFLEEYSFEGEHARKVVQLAPDESTPGTKYFSSVVELFMTAAIIGCHYNKRSKRNTSVSIKPKKIFAEQFYNRSVELKKIFKIVMLNAKREDGDLNAGITKAFRRPETDENYQLFEEYVLGGVDILYDKLIKDTNVNFNDYLANMVDLTNEFREKNTETTKEVSTDPFF